MIFFLISLALCALNLYFAIANGNILSAIAAGMFIVVAADRADDLHAAWRARRQ